MWDSFNGTLLPTSYGASSPYVNFGISPLMATNNMLPPVPMGGMGMYPGMMGGVPYDTFSSRANALPFEHRNQNEGSGWKTALKIAGGILLAGLAYKGGKSLYKMFKGSPKPKITAK
jgi:hypothetical protein